MERSRTLNIRLEIEKPDVLNCENLSRNMKLVHTFEREIWVSSASNETWIVWRWLGVCVVVAGVVLRAWQYAANPSLWADEAAVARNILDRNFLQLVGQPLNYAQVTPPGFLIAVKLSVAVLGSSEYVLRLVPFVGGIATPMLFLLVSRSVLTLLGSIIASFMVSVAVPLVYFSSNLKQYSLDIAITLLVIGVGFQLRRAQLTLLSACGFSLISVPLLFSSQAAVFALTTAGLVASWDAFAVRYRNPFCGSPSPGRGQPLWSAQFGMVF
jgi:predicted membrane-bound mannosyltransferase